MQALMSTEHFDLAGLAQARTKHTFTVTFTSPTLSEELSRRVHEAIASSLATAAMQTDRHVGMRFGVGLQVTMSEDLE